MLDASLHRLLVSKSRECVDVLDFHVWKGIHNLHFEIGKRLHLLPLSARVGKGGHAFNFQIRKRVHNLNFDVGKRSDELDLPEQRFPMKRAVSRHLRIRDNKIDMLSKEADVRENEDCQNLSCHWPFLFTRLDCTRGARTNGSR